jgi:porin
MILVRLSSRFMECHLPRPCRTVAGVLLALTLIPRAWAGPAPWNTADSLDIGATYRADLLANVDGGLRTGTAWLDYLELAADLDVVSAPAVGRLTGRASVFMTNSATFSDRYVGDAMTVSSIDNGYAVQLLEAWIQWQPGSAGRASLRVGLYDLNTEFDTTEARTLFMNSAHGIGHELSQTGRNGPSIFPSTSLAARMAWQPRESVQVLLAAVAAEPDASSRLDASRFGLSRSDGALLIAQLSVAAGPFATLSLGQWGYTREFETLPVGIPGGGPATSRNSGTYLTLESVPVGGDARWRAFGRVGRADPDVNAFDLHLAAGLVGELAWPSGAGSQAGVALQAVRPGDRYSRAQARAGLSSPTERLVEITWRVSLGDHLTLQPNVQYVDDPAGDPRARDAWVVGLRIELAASR